MFEKLFRIHLTWRSHDKKLSSFRRESETFSIGIDFGEVDLPTTGRIKTEAKEKLLKVFITVQPVFNIFPKSRLLYNLTHRKLAQVNSVSRLLSFFILIVVLP